MDTQVHESSTINPQRLVRFLTDLQVGIRKFSMYSGSHASIPEVVNGLATRFHDLVGTNDALLVGITKEEILYQGTTIAKNNPVIRELARLLNQINVAGLLFRRELSPADVRQFLKALADCRGAATIVERERVLDRFRRDVGTIELQFISFREAVKPHDEGTTDQTAATLETQQVWRGLVNRLMTDDVPEESRAVLELEGEGPIDPERLATIINLMSLNRKPGSQSYERTIVGYLHEQARQSSRIGDQRQHEDQRERIGQFLSHLTPEVRQRILRVALEPGGGDQTPAETLLDAMSKPVLLDVLNQLQVSKQDVSLPIVSLLQKFVTLAGSDQAMLGAVKDKLSDHSQLFEELLVKRAERVFYPTRYRALLDEEFAERAQTSAVPLSPEYTTFDEADVDHHLALILIEMLEAPLVSEEQFAGVAASLRALLVGPAGERTPALFTHALSALSAQCASASEERRAFFRERIQEFFQPEMVGHLLAALDPMKQDYDPEVLNQVVRAAGSGIVSVLLDRLEAEENLTARRRLLGLLQKCGSVVAPLALQRLAHPQWYVVRNMLLLLRELQTEEAVSQVASCVAHTSPQVRLAAFQALGVLAPRTDVFSHALEQALNDDDPKVFRAAISHLATTSDPHAVDLAGRLLAKDASGKHQERQVAVLAAIGQIGTAPLVPLLIAVQRRCLWRFWAWRKTRVVRTAAREALAKVRSRE